MNDVEIAALETYIVSDNEHWNSYTGGILADALHSGQFEDIEQPLSLFSFSISTCTKYHVTPLLAVRIIVDELDKKLLSPEQQKYVCDKVLYYLSITEFDNDLKPIAELLRAHKNALKVKPTLVKPSVKDIRETLKALIETEVENLSTTLESLDPLNRLNIVCRLLPFVLPKVQKIHATHGESY